MAQNDDRRCGAWRAIGEQEVVGEREREPGIRLVGVDHLAMLSLELSRPVRAVTLRCCRLCTRCRGRKPSEPKHRCTGEAKEISARRPIRHICIESFHLLLRSACILVRLARALLGRRALWFPGRYSLNMPELNLHSTGDTGKLLRNKRTIFISAERRLPHRRLRARPT